MLFNLLLIAFTAYLFFQWKRRLSLPPGPVPLHILGNLPQFGYYIWKRGGIVNALKLMQKEYGDIFTVWLGPLATVHIGTLELSHELMVKQGNNYADRWAPLLFNYLRDGHGVLTSNGIYWQEQRRFTLHTLRNFGVGRNLIEERIMMEFDLRCCELEERFKNNDNHVVNAKEFVDLMIGSIINRMLFSVRFEEHNQTEFFDLKYKMDIMTEEFSTVDLYVNKWLTKFPLWKKRFDDMFKAFDDVYKFIEIQVNERREAVLNGEHVIIDQGQDFVDAYLKKMEDEKDNPITSFTIKSLLVSLLDLWAAGQETTTTTLLWAFVYFLRFPDKAKKAREEIQCVTHNSRALSLKDKGATPYLNAMLHEINRHASIVSMNLFRQVREKTKIGDYVIEPGVPITAELSLIMSDEKNFVKSDKFYPERFLESEKLEQKVIPFGIGKRACPGESLARAELYLVLGNLLARYEVVPDGVIPSMEGSAPMGLFKRPEKFNIKLFPIRAHA